MISWEKELELVRDVLKASPRGLTVTDVAEKLLISRNSSAKYLEMLLMAGQVDMRTFGRSKIFSLSSRMPLATTLSLSSEMIVFIDESLQIVEANEQFLKFVEIPRGKVLGQSIESTSLPLLLHRDILLNIRDTLRGREFVREIGVSKGRAEYYFKVKIIPIVAQDGRRMAAIIFENVTDRKRAELALKESEARYRAVVENQTDMICRILPDTTITFVNEAWCHTFQVAREDVIGKKHIDFIPPHYKTLFQRDIDNICLDKPASIVEADVVMPDGKKHWIQYSFRGLFGDDRRLAELQIVARDITSRKNAELALRDSEEKYRFLVENSKDITWKTDLEGKWTFISNNVEGVVGLKPAEVIGRTIWDFLAPECHDLVRDKILRRCRGEDLPPYEALMVGKDGRKIPFELTAVPIVDDKGKIVGVQGVSRDVTERRRAVKALRESEEKFRVLAETTRAGIVLFRFDKFIYVNHMVEMSLGYTKDEMLAMNFRDVVHPDSWELVLRRGQERLQGLPLPSTYELKALTKGGEIRWVEFSPAVIDYQGQPTFIATIFDITERIRVEEALRESEEKFRVLAETTRAGIVLFRYDKFIYVNPFVEMSLGYTKDELLAMNFWDVVQPDSQEMVLSRGQERLQGLPLPSTYELKALTKGGEIRWVEFSPAVIDYQGQPTFIATIFDITERNRVEEALRESEEKFRLLAETSPAAIFIYQEDQFDRYVYVNPAMESITGYSRDELMKIDPIDIIHPDYREKVRKLVSQNKQGVMAHSRYEVKILTKDGRERWMDGSSASMTYDNKPAGLTVAFDVTDRKQAEEALKSAKQQAELYLDLMGHDIRNMNQIGIGFLELVMGSPDISKHDKELLLKSLGSLENSTRLIDSVRKLQKARSGELNLHEIDACQTFMQVLARYSSMPGVRASFSYDIPASCPVRANELLHEVFENIVGNAIKHGGPEPTVNVQFDTVDREGRIFNRFIVEDNGPGIPDEMKDRIFNRLQRGGSEANSNGLGLYIAKSLVESYDGRVWAEDRVPGDHTKGARFVVMLPLAGK